MEFGDNNNKSIFQRRETKLIGFDKCNEYVCEDTIIYFIKLKTIKELDSWMTQNCYNNNYAIGDRNIDEGLGLDIFGSLYIWYYTERGQRQTLNYFRTEKEAVEFAFETITADKFAKSHLVGFINNPKTLFELETELQNRNIEFWKDEIPYYSINKPTTRVFVLGCDIKKVLDLQSKYGKI